MSIAPPTSPAALLTALRAAPSFEAAADLCLRAVLEASLSSLDPRAELVRGAVHLRPGGGGYAGLRHLALPPHQAQGEMAPSLSAWAQLQRVGEPVSLDVRLGRIEGLNAQASKETIHRHIARDASHVLALPLRGPQGSLHGMITVEAQCLEATGEAGFWEGQIPALSLIADLCTPFLVGLPPERTEAPRDDDLLPVVGRALAPIMDLLETFARVNETILISGATGTGKSRLARWCHAHSPRAEQPFEHLDLLSVPEDMQLAELFGWRRGAFTGAHQDRKGAVERAEGGTLFLDEIDKLSLSAQAGLLQLLETRSWRRLGDSGGDRQADLRFLVGTNQDLAQAVAEGRFREDLYYRIQVLPVHLPSLDERRDEIGAWGGFMVQRRHQEAGAQGSVSLSQEAITVLQGARWPGNLRQLDNVLRRAYAVALLGRSGSAELVIDGSAVQRALGLERPAATPSIGEDRLIPLLQRTAERMLDAMERGERELEHARALRAFVLAEAARRQGGVKEAYLYFGREKTVQGRNHTRDYKAALQEAEQMAQALGVALPAELLS